LLKSKGDSKENENNGAPVARCRQPKARGQRKKTRKSAGHSARSEKRPQVARAGVRLPAGASASGSAAQQARRNCSQHAPGPRPKKRARLAAGEGQRTERRGRRRRGPAPVFLTMATDGGAWADGRKWNENIKRRCARCVQTAKVSQRTLVAGRPQIGLGFGFDGAWAE